MPNELRVIVALIAGIVLGMALAFHLIERMRDRRREPRVPTPMEREIKAALAARTGAASRMGSDADG